MVNFCFWLVSLFVLKGCFSQQQRKYPYSGMTFTDGKYCPNVSFDTSLANKSLYHIYTTGANYVSIIVTQYQDYHNSTDIYPLYTPMYGDKYTYITATESQLKTIINSAHSMGLSIMLKPHIDLTQDPNYWRGEIGEGFNSTQWSLWFNSYTNYILYYANIAQELNVELFSVSCELITPSTQTSYWRQLIPKIRNVYSGLLTDSANWAPPNGSGEVVDKQWWDLMDIIGCDEYYNLNPNIIYPTVNYLINAWQPLVQQLYNLSITYNKPVLFTEIGYCSGPLGECDKGSTANSTDLKNQANHFEAALSAFESHDWLLGFFWWNWATDPYFVGPNNDCMTPAYKPAEDVLRNWYQTNITQPPPANLPPLCDCTL